MSAKSSPLRRVGNRLASAKSKTGLPQCSQAASAWARHQATPAIFAILARCRAAAKLRGRANFERKLAGEGGSEAKAQHLEHRIARGMAAGTLTMKERAAKVRELQSKLAESRAARAAKYAPAPTSKPVPRHVGPAVPASRRIVADSARTVKAHGPIPAAKLGQVEAIRLSGNTFAHRERIAAMGAKWDAEHRAWVVPGHAIRPELHTQIARDLQDLHKAGVRVDADMAMVHRKPRPLPVGALKRSHVARIPTQTPTVAQREGAEKDMSAEGAPPSALVTARLGSGAKPSIAMPARHVASVPAPAAKPIVYHTTRRHDRSPLTARFVRGAAPPRVPLAGRAASLRGGRSVEAKPWAFARLVALENRARARLKAAEAEVESNPLVGGKRAMPGFAAAARRLDRNLNRRRRLASLRADLQGRFSPGSTRGGYYTGD